MDPITGKSKITQNQRVVVMGSFLLDLVMSTMAQNQRANVEMQNVIKSTDSILFSYLLLKPHKVYVFAARLAVY